MRLIELIKNLKDYKIYNFKNQDIKGISCDSRKIKEGFIFVAIKGSKTEGERFIPEAIKRGSKVIVAQNRFDKEIPAFITYIQAKDSRKIYSRLCAEFYQHPSHRLKVIGVTGTNGKTTVTYLLEKILKSQGKDSLLIGTINYRYKDKIISSHNTTPSCEEIQSLLSESEKEGIGYAIMEVSSHGLEQGRVEDVNFSFAIFTNLNQDHLDYHRSMSRYFSAKARLFRMLSYPAKAIVNRDDPYGRKILKLCRVDKITYGLDKKADIYATCIKQDINGVRFLLHTPKGKIKISSSLLGEYNIYNILAAVSFACAEGFDLQGIRKAIEEFSAPAGRLERVYAGDFFVYVDYAHTPVALKSVLSILRKVFKKRIIVVFGCGGERDRGKRPKMGRIATQLADRVLITSDNPRNEDPLRIIKDILKGIKKKNYTVIPDRREAIFTALEEAERGDVVLVAGKGHEQYQIIEDRYIFFDDRQIIKEYLKD